MNTNDTHTTSTPTAADDFVVALIPMVARLLQKQTTPPRRLVARSYQSMEVEVSYEGITIVPNERNSKHYNLRPRQAVGLYLALTSIGVPALIDAIDQMINDRLAESLDGPTFVQAPFTGEGLTAICGYSAVYRTCDDVTLALNSEECHIETTATTIDGVRYGGPLRLPVASVVDLYAGLTCKASAAILTALDRHQQNENEAEYQRERVADRERITAAKQATHTPNDTSAA